MNFEAHNVYSRSHAKTKLRPQTSRGGVTMHTGVTMHSRKPAPPLPRPFLALALAAFTALVALTAAAPAAAQTAQNIFADSSLIPDADGVDGPDFSPGDSFRLLFVTTTTGGGAPDFASTYHTRVQNAAADATGAGMPIAAFSSQFRALVSTRTEHARDQTSTTGPGVPIYWLNGAKVADNNADFYDDSWDSYLARHETGGLVTNPGNRSVWTGSKSDGTRGVSSRTSNGRPGLGGSFAIIGRPSSGGPIKIRNGNNDARLDQNLPLYALSPVLNVVPSPDTTLSALSFEGSPVFTPTFDSATTSYAARVSNSVTTFTVTPTLSNASATATISATHNGTTTLSSRTIASGTGMSVPLNEGVNVISVTVSVTTSGTTYSTTYTVGVRRVAPPPAAPEARELPDDSLLVPTGLGIGSKFRMLFVTSDMRNGGQSDIDLHYNAFVRRTASRASGIAAPIVEFSSQFRALVSSETVDMRDNTATTGTGVPIYWLGGDKVADDYTDFYDGSWDNRTPRTETGGAFTYVQRPILTGSTATGFGFPGFTAGSSDSVRLGRLDSSNNGGEINFESGNHQNDYHLYALSPVITVVAAGPTVGITSNVGLTNTANIADGALTFTFEFSEDVSDFDADDITATGGGTKGAFAGTGDTYTLVVPPTADTNDGVLTISVAEGVATSTMTGRTSLATDTATQAYDTQAPTMPSIDGSIATDNVINAAEATTGVAVTGTTGVIGSETGSDTRTVTLCAVPASVTATPSDANPCGVDTMFTADTTDTATTWRYTLTTDNINTRLGQGSVTLTAIATDAAGNTAVSSGRAITVDTVAPPLPTFNTVNTDNIIDRSNTFGNAADCIGRPLSHTDSDCILFSGDKDSNTEVTIFFGGSDNACTGGASGDPKQVGSTWFYVLPNVDGNTLDVLGQGEVSVCVTAEDDAGNPSTATHRLTVDTVPPTAPTIDAALIAGDDIINAAERTAGVAVTGTTGVIGSDTSSDTNNVILCAGATSITSASPACDGTTFEATAAAGTTTWSYTLNMDEITTFSEGVVTLTAIAADSVGNTAASSVRDITVDTTAPVFVRASESTNRAQVAAAIGADTDTIVHDAVATDNNRAPDTGITYALAGADFATFALTTDSGILTPAAATTLDMATTYSVDITATDDAGNAATQYLAIVVSDRPTVTISSNVGLTNTATIADGALTFTFSWREAVTGFGDETSDITVSGGTVTGSTAAASLVEVTAGTYTLEVTPTPNTNNGLITVNVSADAVTSTATSSTNPPTTATQAYDTQAPAEPSIGDVATDDIINFAEANDDVAVTGVIGSDTSTVTLCAGATSVIDPECAGGMSFTAAAATTTWSYSLTTTDITALGGGVLTFESVLTFTAIATDAAGNTAVSAGRAITVDTVVPAAPVFASGPFEINILFRQTDTNVLLVGTTDLGTTVTICFGGSDAACAGGRPREADIQPSGMDWLYTMIRADHDAIGQGDVTLLATATDAAGNTSAVGTSDIITVDLTAPVFTSGGTVSVAVGAATTFTVYDADATDNGGAAEMADDGVTYSLSGTNAGLFSIEPATGEVTYLTPPPAAATHRITVTATDTVDNPTTRGVTISVLAAPEPEITDSALSEYTNGVTTFTFTWNEMVSGFETGDITVDGGGTKGTFTGTDPGMVYTLVVTPPTAPTNDGVLTVTVAANAVTGALTKTGNEVKIATQRFDTVAPVFTSGDTATFAVNTPINTAFYTAVATDGGGDADDDITYSLSDAGRFSIFSDGGVIYFDRPSIGIDTFEITATDRGGNTDTITVTVTVTPSNDATLRELSIILAGGSVLSLTPSGGSTPGFDSGVFTYTAAAPGGTPAVTMAATPTDGNASIEYAVGSPATATFNTTGALNVDIGTNTLTARVTAEDGTTTLAYTIILTVPVDPASIDTAQQTQIVPADWALIPDQDGVTGPDFDPGESFRLLFTTAGVSDATSSVIADYNAFVQTDASGATGIGMPIRPFSAKFRALISTAAVDASTAAVDARDNTATYNTGIDAPIYWLGNKKVADDYTDFYDGTWDFSSGSDFRNRNGDETPSSGVFGVVVWTGTNGNGTGAAGFEAGQSRTVAGQVAGPASPDGTTLRTSPGGSPHLDSSFEYYLYALSPVFIVQPDTALSELRVTPSGGLTPDFDTAVFTYTATAPAGTTTVTVAATATETNDGIQYAVGANPADDAFADSGVFAVSAGSNVLTVRVTAEDDSMTRDYTITLTVPVSLSNDATLKALSIKPHFRANIVALPLTPAFAAGITAYIAESHTRTTVIRVAAEATSSAASVQYAATDNNPTIGNFRDSGNFNINFLSTPRVTVRVTAEDGTTQDYTVRLTIRATASTDADLNDLTVTTSDGTGLTLTQSGGTTTGFATTALAYTATASAGTTSVTVAATVNDLVGASVQYAVGDSPADADFDDSGTLTVATGLNVLTARVTAEDGTTRRDYTITLTVLSADATLGALSISPNLNQASPLPLSPAFAAGTFAYTATASVGTTTVAVTATTNDGAATYTITGTAADGNALGVTSTTTGGDVSGLTTGDNVITVTVTAEDGTALDYTIMLTVRATASNDADLRALSVTPSGGGATLTLNPTFETATTFIAFTAEASVGTTAVAVTATTNDGAATYTITGTAADGTDLGVTSTTTGGDVSGLTTGDNTITVTVTAEDGTTTRDYTITLTVPEALMFADSVNDQRYSIGEAITDLILPEASGGVAPLSYTLSPAADIPSGLTFAPAARTLTGTPDTIETRTLTYTVTDAAVPPVSTALTFLVSIECGPMVAPSTTEIPLDLNCNGSDDEPADDGILTLPANHGVTAVNIGVAPQAAIDAPPTGITFAFTTDISLEGTLTADATICLPTTDVPPGRMPTLYHDTSGGVGAATWTAIGTDTTTRSGYVCGMTTAFSPLAVGYASTPTVMHVTSTSGAYNAGDRFVTILVHFSEPVTVTGTPQLALNGVGTTRFLRVRNENELLFRYTFAANDIIADLAYTGTDALTLPDGVTIQSTAGAFDADLTLPVPGTPNSLSGSSDVVIDTIAPVFTGTGAGTGTVNSALDVIVYDADATDNGTFVADATPDTGVTYALSGPDAGMFTIDEDTGRVTFAVAQLVETTRNIVITATDVAGNTATQDVRISVVDAPAVRITDNFDGDYANGAVTFTFAWDEMVTGFGDETTDIAVTGGTVTGLTAAASLVQVTAGLTYTLVVTPTTATNDGTITVTVAANAVTGAVTNTGNLETMAFQEFDTVAPVFAETNAATTFAANTPITTEVYNADAIDGGVTDAAGLTYSLSGTDDDALFDIDADDGGVTYLASPSMATTHTFTVTATDKGGNTATVTVTVDVTISVVAAPEVTITDNFDGDYANGAVTFTFAWDEMVTGFETGDITVTGGTAGTFTETTDGMVYTLVVTPDINANDGTITVTVVANAVTGTPTNAATATQDYDTVAPVFADDTDNVTFATNTPITTEVYNADATDGGNADDGITYSLSGTDALSFTINIDNGVVTYRESPAMATTHTFTVTATDKGNNTDTIDVTVTVTASADATLRELSVTTAGRSLPLTQSDGNTRFDPNVLTYTAAAPVGTTTVTVAATATDGNAGVRYAVGANPADADFSTSGGLTVATGTNILTARVTAEDGSTTQDYRITLTVPAAATDATLSVLSVTPSGGSALILTRPDGSTTGFATGVSTYTATALAGTTAVAVVATTNDGAATYTITGTAAVGNTALGVTSTTTGGAVTGLTAGDNVITVTVTAEDGTTTRAYTITLTVPEALVFASPVDDQRYSIGVQITDLILPTASGGVDPLSYTLSPAADLPAGLMFTAASRTLSGTPTERVNRALIYTVTDSADPPISTAVTFLVSIGCRPMVISSTTEIPLDLNCDGIDNDRADDGVLTLPDGHQVTRVHIGVPPQSAIDSLPGVMGFGLTTDIALTPDIPLTANATVCLPTRPSGLDPVLYHYTSLGTSAPAWREIGRDTDTRTGYVCGETRTFSPFAVGYAAVASTDATLSALSVTPSGGMALTLTPVFDVGTTAYTATAPFDTTTVRVVAPANDANATVAIAVTDAGGAALTVDPATGDVSGLAAGGDYDIIVTVTAENTTITRDYTITLTVLEQLMFASSVNDQHYFIGEEITALILPEASGGVAPLSYTLSPDADIPAGLMFVTASRTLSGTPTERVNRALTYTVTDSAVPPVSTAVTFLVSIGCGPMVPSSTTEIPLNLNCDSIENDRADDGILTLPANHDVARVHIGVPPQSAIDSLPGGRVFGLTTDITLLTDMQLTADVTATVCLPTLPSGLAPVLYHYTSSAWREIPSDTETRTGYICGETTAFAPLAVGYAAGASTVTRLNEQILTRVAQAVTAGTMAAVAARVESMGGGTPAPSYQVGGQSSLRGLLKSHGKAMLEGEMETARLLDGVSFSLPLSATRGRSIDNPERSPDRSPDDNTDDSLEDSTDGSLEDSTDGSLEDSTDGSLEVSTDGILEDSTDGSLEDSTEGSPEVSTDSSLEDSTDGSLEVSTDVVPSHTAGAGDGGGHGGGLTMWGKSEYRGLDGGNNRDAIDWSGDMLSAYVGVDRPVGRDKLAGLALSWNKGNFDYEDEEQDIHGDYQYRATNFSPYFGWLACENIRLWGMANYGRGEIDISMVDTSGARNDDSAVIDHFSLAGGFNGQLLTSYSLYGGTASLALKGDVSMSRVAVEEFEFGFGLQEGIAAQEVGSHRLRLLLGGEYQLDLYSGGMLTEFLEVGGRYDGGDGMEGSGLEVGGGLRYVNLARDLTIEGNVRTLLGHQYDEWGIDFRIQLSPPSGRGLSLNVRPVWGKTQSAAERLWNEGAVDMTGDVVLQGSLDTEVGYGVASSVMGASGLLTPYMGMTAEDDGDNRLRVGGRFSEVRGLSLSLEGAQDNTGDEVNNTVLLRGELAF